MRIRRSDSTDDKYQLPDTQTGIAIEKLSYDFGFTYIDLYNVGNSGVGVLY